MEMSVCACMQTLLNVRHERANEYEWKITERRYTKDRFDVYVCMCIASKTQNRMCQYKITVHTAHSLYGIHTHTHKTIVWYINKQVVVYGMYEFFFCVHIETGYAILFFLLFFVRMKGEQNCKERREKDKKKQQHIDREKLTRPRRWWSSIYALYNDNCFKINGCLPFPSTFKMQLPWNLPKQLQGGNRSLFQKSFFSYAKTDQRDKYGRSQN